MGGEIKTIIFAIAVCIAMCCLISELEAKEISRSIKNKLEAVSQVSSLATECKCTNGYCEKDENGILVCKCPVEYGLDTSGDKCTKCNCGSNANCTFNGVFYGQKTCICPNGSYADETTCKSCNCGKDFNCINNKWTGKICMCGTGYSVTNGVCVGTCQSNPCKNNGKCQVKGKDIECQCVAPYTGEFCEERVDSTTNKPTSDFGSTTYPPLSTQNKFSATPESTVPPSSTGTEKMVSPCSTEYPTTKTSPILELIKSFVVKVKIYKEKI